MMSSDRNYQRKVKLFVADVFIWCFLCALLAVGLTNANTIEQYSTISLRFNTPVSGKAAFTARQYSIEHSEEKSFWPNFWHEGKASFSSELITTDTDCIFYSGNASVVWPASYLYGAAPGVTDGIGCAVSSALAWRLWGSMNVVGKVLDVDDKQRIVRGVFKDERELALLSFTAEDTSQSYSAADLQLGPNGAVRSDALTYAIASGLGNPDYILMGGNTAFISKAVMALPLIILGGYCLALIIGFFQKRFAVMRKFIWFLLPLSFAICLPGLLDSLPIWLIPTKWSDFSFYTTLAQKATDALYEFLSVTPKLCDIDGRILLLKQAGIAFVSVCCALSICFRWHIRASEKK